MLKMKKVATREVVELSADISQVSEDCIPYINTMTADNGKEFAQQKKIAKACEIEFYFTNPYCSWERVANENLNEIIK